MNRLFPEAERLARAEGIEQPAAEHLLLASLDLHDGVALDALAEVNIDRAALRAAIGEQHTAALRSAGIAADDNTIDASLPEPAPATGVYRSQGSMQQLFQQAIQFAKRDHAPLNSGHVLLAATETDHGTIARALDRLHVARRDLHAMTHQRLAASTAP